MPIIDAHQHFWDLETNYVPWLVDEPPIPFRYGDYSAIRRTYLPEAYRQDTGRFEIEATVYIETEYDPSDPLGETEWVHTLADREGLPTVMVAQAWLDRDDVEEVLACQAGYPLVRGIRHKPAAAASPDKVESGKPGSMSDPKWRRGYALLARHGLSFDLQVPWWHLHEARALAEEFGDIPIILNHTGLPADRSPEGLGGWKAALENFARAPNAFLKISGIGRPSHPWTVADNRPLVLDAIAAFGTHRCMFASNFPVDSLVADFETIFDGFEQITASFPQDDRDALFRANARRIYRIDS